MTVGILAVINIGYLQNLIPFSGIPGVQCWQQLFSGELKDYHGEWIAVFYDKEMVRVVIQDDINED